MIELAGVRVDHPRGGPPLIDGADLAVGRGEVVLIAGPGGAGTSHLLGAVLGAHELAAGRVALFGRDLARLRRSSLLRLRRRIGVVPEDLRLLDETTALANVLLPLDIDHVLRKAAALRAAEALGRVGLAAEADVRVDLLSLAERQRVAVARALVREPPIVIADQPTSHQDAERAVLIARVLAEVASAGGAVLVASRDPALWAHAKGAGWRTATLRDGAIAETPPIAVEEIDVLHSEPVPAAPAADAIPNVVPFPITARTRGVG